MKRKRESLLKQFNGNFPEEKKEDKKLKDIYNLDTEPLTVVLNEFIESVKKENPNNDNKNDKIKEFTTCLEKINFGYDYLIDIMTCKDEYGIKVIRKEIIKPILELNVNVFLDGGKKENIQKKKIYKKKTYKKKT